MDRNHHQDSHRPNLPSIDEDLEEKELNVLGEQLYRDSARPKSIDDLWRTVEALKSTCNAIRKEVKGLTKSNEALTHLCNVILSKLVAVEVNTKNKSPNKTPSSGGPSHNAANTRRGSRKVKAETSPTIKDPTTFNSVGTIMIEVSDDDDDTSVSPHPMSKKMDVGTCSRSQERSPTIEFAEGSLSKSNYRRGVHHQMQTKFREASLKDTTSIMKSLNFNTSTSASALKIPKTEPGLKMTPRKRGSNEQNTVTGVDDYQNVLLDEYEEQTYVLKGSILPKSLPTKFSPTTDMGLTPEEAQLSLYIFYMNGNQNELLMKSEHTMAYRRDFECLCPGNKISNEMITLMARKCTWMQQYVTLQTTWSLPPKFAHDICEGATVGDLVSDYVFEWMHSFKDLKHGDFISKIVATNYYPPSFGDVYMNLFDWEIMEAPGMLNTGQSKNSTVWVMDWMNMEHCFQPNLHGKLNENAVRMRLALELITGDHNEIKTKLQEKVDIFCRAIGYNI
ncbi:hypothetical protein SESBI_19275 [Sesbania bispinosa]|nr:hypothetical protein SESBI_19275 [Sesbania bispinosa]